jgi:hypothetical protein
MKDFLQLSSYKLNYLLSLAICLSALGFSIDNAEAQRARYASEQRRNAAVAYYARARTMLVEALAEYEQGRRYAKPDLLHDPEEFRLTVISLTEQLNRLVDPHIRITRDGVRIKGNPRLIKRERDRLPPVPDGAQDANDYGEKRRMEEIQAARARLYEPDAVEEEPEMMEEAPEPEDTGLSKREQVDQVIEQAVAEARQDLEPEPEQEQTLEASAKTEATQEPLPEENIMEGTESAELSEEGKEPSEDQRIASAIEQAIQDRLKNLEVGLEEEEESE